LAYVTVNYLYLVQEIILILKVYSHLNVVKRSKAKRSKDHNKTTISRSVRTLRRQFLTRKIFTDS